MADKQPGDVTVLLRAVNEGTPGAADRLIALVYDELKWIASNRAPASDVLLQPTALVHEAYLRLFERGGTAWENRHHFFWAAARAMRDILVEQVRHDLARKRGSGCGHIALDNDVPAISGTADLLAINEAIRKLELVHPDTARLVMLRFFAGLTREQISEITGMSAAAVWRDWTFAKAWLLDELGGSPSSGTDRNQ